METYENGLRIRRSQVRILPGAPVISRGYDIFVVIPFLFLNICSTIVALSAGILVEIREQFIYSDANSNNRKKLHGLYLSAILSPISAIREFLYLRGFQAENSKKLQIAPPIGKTLASNFRRLLRILCLV